MTKNSKILLFLAISTWISFLVGSIIWNVNQNWEAQKHVQLGTARSFFQLIVATRAWNSNMGGVYVPITEQTQPNPYLQTVNRDIECTNGMKLTQINPAYMTRLISGLTEEQNNNVKFHITSLKPIRPANKPVEWEKEALTAFEKKIQTEHFTWETETNTVYYMAPLISQESCLPCHAQQGYQLGDIRGGISVSFQAQRTIPWSIILTLSLVAATGSLEIFVLGQQLSKSFLLLEKQAQIDELTQIYNRRHFDNALQKEYQFSSTQQSPLSIIICDADFFKSYNDLYGHGAGDDCLKRLAWVLKESLKRPTDIAARIGGEEFGILLPNTPMEGALQVAETLRVNVENLKIPHADNKPFDYVTISLGVSTDNGEINLMELLQKTDQALYQAKQTGRNRVCAIQ